jgi:hypothetical protein
MTEDFLQFVWRLKLWDFIDAKTTEGESVVIKKPGNINYMDGPDFLEACIIIGEKEWNGHVEIHVKTSEWFNHGHQNDKKYQPVILHVVYEDDIEDALPIPTISLKGKIKRAYLNNYKTLLENKQWLACGDGLKNFPQAKLSLWLQRMLVERFEQKHEQLKGVLVSYDNHWDYVLFIWVMRAFGYFYNADQMVRLANAIPFKAVLKTKSIYELEVLMQGMAGFLSENQKDQQLFKHFTQLYNLTPLPNHIWIKKVRPPIKVPFIFGSVANLYFNNSGLFSNIVALFEQYRTENVLPFIQLKDVAETKQLHLWLNAFIPVLLLHAKQMGNEEWISSLWELMEQMKPDNNTLMTRFKKEGITINNAAKSQSLLHLHKNYCNPKKCLNCPVGLSLVKTT